MPRGWPIDWKGVGHDGSSGAFPGLDLLGATWWYDWRLNGTRDSTYVPMDHTGQENIAGIVDDMPSGSYYMIFNEPKLQGISGVLAAERYFTQYRAIKAVDPTAKVGGINLVVIPDIMYLPTPSFDTNYLHVFLQRLGGINAQEGGLAAKLDFYAVHGYYVGGSPCVSPGCGAAPVDGASRVTFEHLQEHLTRVHGVMADLYSPLVTSTTPVWITETAALEEGIFNSQAHVIDRAMVPLINWLKSWGFATGKVARVAWFVTRWVHVGPHPNYYGHLLNVGLNELTNVGRLWKEEGIGMYETETVWAGTPVQTLVPNGWNTIVHNLGTTSNKVVVFNGDYAANSFIVKGAQTLNWNSFRFYAEGGSAGPARINWVVLE